MEGKIDGEIEMATSTATGKPLKASKITTMFLQKEKKIEKKIASLEFLQCRMKIEGAIRRALINSDTSDRRY